MLTHAYEFIRTADPNPSTEMVTRRKESAGQLAAQLGGKQNRELMLSCMQAVINGFDNASEQGAPAISATIKVIRDRDPAFPSELKENAAALRACAALAVGEAIHANDKGDGITAALALRAGLFNRPSPKDKHIQTMLRLLYDTGERLIAVSATNQRQRATAAFRNLQELKEPEPEGSDWESLVPTIQAAFHEIHSQLAADREEIDSLWWTFQAYSEFARKPMSKLSPEDAALCAGTELADRAVLPPLASSTELVRRGIEAGRKSSELTPISLQDLVNKWDPELLKTITGETVRAALTKKYPTLLPLLWGCVRRGDATGAKVGKEFAGATGIPTSYSCDPAVWGCQVFHERILMRALTDVTGG